jgi:transcriptional adapter 2-alpha
MDFDLCLECFSVGVELNAAQPSGHKAWHDYRVIDNLSFPMFHPDWGVSVLLGIICVYLSRPTCRLDFPLPTALNLFCFTCTPQADEEQLLLEAIDTYGPGNWNAVAEHVGPCKTAAQCKVQAFPRSLPCFALQHLRIL